MGFGKEVKNAARSVKTPSDNDFTLELKMLRLRLDIHEAILLKDRLAITSLEQSCGVKSDDPIRQKIVADLEATAAQFDRDLYSAPEYSSLTDPQRLLYADEYREILEKMKSYVRSLP